MNALFKTFLVGLVVGSLALVALSHLITPPDAAPSTASDNVNWFRKLSHYPLKG